MTIHFGHNEAELKYGDFRIKGQIPLKTISELLFNNDVFTIHDVLPLLEPCDDTADYDGIVEKLKACNAIEASANDKAGVNKDEYLEQFLIPPNGNPDYAISLMRNANPQSLEFQLIYNNVHLIQAIKKGRKAVWEFLESAPVIKLKEEFLFCYHRACLEECLDNDVSSRKLSLDVSLQRLEKACCLMSSKSMAELFNMYKSVCSLAEGQYSDSSHSKLCGMANKYSISDNDFQGNIELLCRIASIVQGDATSFSKAMSDLIEKLDLFFQKREEYPSLSQMDEDSDMLDKRDKFCEEFESGNYDAQINGWLSSYGKEFAEAHSKLEELKKALAYLPGFRRVLDEIDAFINYREFDTLDFLMYKIDDYNSSKKDKCIYSYPRNIPELGKLPDAHHNVLIAKFEGYLKKHSRRKKPNILSKTLDKICGCLPWRPWHRQPSF